MKISLRSAITMSAICAVTALRGADLPKFEVTSVKVTNECVFNNTLGPGTVVLKGDPLKPILVEAFKVGKDQIVGPSWLDEDCFEIFGKMPAGATADQIPAMLQALLAERFKLAAHKEDRPSQVYALVVDKNGPKFKESDPSSPLPGMRAGTVRFQRGGGAIKGSISMAALARSLSGKTYGQVQDFTGLKGKYDIDLSWAPDAAFDPPGSDAKAVEAPAPSASLFTALRESLGLRLEPRKEPLEFLVIDHIDRVPSGN